MARLLHRWGGWRGPCPRATKAGRGGACPSSGPPGLGGNTGAVDRELSLRRWAASSRETLMYPVPGERLIAVTPTFRLMFE